MLPARRPGERAQAMARWTSGSSARGRLIQLLDPPFDTSPHEPGLHQGLRAGRARERRPVHARGDLGGRWHSPSSGDAERAWELFALIKPVNHGTTPQDIARYRVEPYVVAADVYSRAPHIGRGGWTWYTGSAGWMYQLLVEALLGLERRASRLRIRPLMPKEWTALELDYRFGASIYRIACCPVATGKETQVSVDGIDSPDGWFTLVDDGGAHSVAVGFTRDGQRAGSSGRPARGDGAPNAEKYRSK